MVLGGRSVLLEWDMGENIQIGYFDSGYFDYEDYSK